MLSNALLFFVAALFVCHIPALCVLKYRCTDAARWKRWCEYSDYAYLTLAALAIIPAATDLQRIIDRVQFESVLARGGYMGTADLAEVVARTLPDDPASPKEWFQDAAIAVQSAEAAKHKAREEFETGKTEQGHRSLDEVEAAVDSFFKKHHKPPIDKAVKQDAEIITQSILELKNLANQTRQAEKKLAHSSLPESLLFLAPFLVGLGIAIRIGKISTKLAID